MEALKLYDGRLRKCHNCKDKAKILWEFNYTDGTWSKVFRICEDCLRMTYEKCLKQNHEEWRKKVLVEVI